jgi:hypothetical protein
MPSLDRSKALPPYQDDKGGWHCGARTRSGKPCKNDANELPHRCYKHGGGGHRVRVNRAKTRLEDKARKMLIDLDLPGNVDPITRLLELAAEADAFRGAIAMLVNHLDDPIRYRDDKGAEQLRAEVAVYERALDRAARLYLDLCKLNLEERLVRIRESEARALANALNKALNDAGLTGEQQQDVKRATAKHLRLVS